MYEGENGRYNWFQILKNCKNSRVLLRWEHFDMKSFSNPPWPEVKKDVHLQKMCMFSLVHNITLHPSILCISNGWMNPVARLIPCVGEICNWGWKSWSLQAILSRWNPLKSFFAYLFEEKFFCQIFYNILKISLLKIYLTLFIMSNLVLTILQYKLIILDVTVSSRQPSFYLDPLITVCTYQILFPEKAIETSKCFQHWISINSYSIIQCSLQNKIV